MALNLVLQLQDCFFKKTCGETFEETFEETLEDEFEITFLKIELALLNTRQTNFSSDLSHPMAPMHMPRPLILMGHFDMWKKNETQ